MVEQNCFPVQFKREQLTTLVTFLYKGLSLEKAVIKIKPYTYAGFSLFKVLSFQDFMKISLSVWLTLQLLQQVPSKQTGRQTDKVLNALSQNNPTPRLVN